jgi:hypothetical protein
MGMIVRPGEGGNQVVAGDARIRAVMSEPDSASRRQVQGDVAALAGLVERAAGDLTLGEEPSNFAAALEAGAPGE